MREMDKSYIKRLRKAHQTAAHKTAHPIWRVNISDAGAIVERIQPETLERQDQDDQVLITAASTKYEREKAKLDQKQQEYERRKQQAPIPTAPVAPAQPPPKSYEQKFQEWSDSQKKYNEDTKRQQDEMSTPGTEIPTAGPQMPPPPPQMPPSPKAPSGPGDPAQRTPQTPQQKVEQEKNKAKPPPGPKATEPRPTDPDWNQAYQPSENQPVYPDNSFNAPPPAAPAAPGKGPMNWLRQQREPIQDPARIPNADQMRAWAQTMMPVPEDVDRIIRGFVGKPGNEAITQNPELSKLREKFVEYATTIHQHRLKYIDYLVSQVEKYKKNWYSIGSPTRQQQAYHKLIAWVTRQRINDAVRSAIYNSLNFLRDHAQQLTHMGDPKVGAFLKEAAIPPRVLHAIWIMQDNGYDVSDPNAVSRHLGRLKDGQQLQDQFNRSMKTMGSYETFMDWVDWARGLNEDDTPVSMSQAAPPQQAKPAPVSTPARGPAPTPAVDPVSTPVVDPAPTTAPAPPAQPPPAPPSTPVQAPVEAPPPEPESVGMDTLQSGAQYQVIQRMINEMDSLDDKQLAELSDVLTALPDEQYDALGDSVEFVGAEQKRRHDLKLNKIKEFIRKNPDAKYRVQTEGDDVYELIRGPDTVDADGKLLTRGGPKRHYLDDDGMGPGYPGDEQKLLQIEQALTQAKIPLRNPLPHKKITNPPVVPPGKRYQTKPMQQMLQQAPSNAPPTAPPPITPEDADRKLHPEKYVQSPPTDIGMGDVMAPTPATPPPAAPVVPAPEPEHQFKQPEDFIPPEGLDVFDWEPTIYAYLAHGDQGGYMTIPGHEQPLKFGDPLLVPGTQSALGRVHIISPKASVTGKGLIPAFIGQGVFCKRLFGDLMDGYRKEQQMDAQGNLLSSKQIKDKAKGEATGYITGYAAPKTAVGAKDAWLRVYFPLLGQHPGLTAYMPNRAVEEDNNRGVISGEQHPSWGQPGYPGYEKEGQQVQQQVQEPAGVQMAPTVSGINTVNGQPPMPGDMVQPGQMGLQGPGAEAGGGKIKEVKQDGTIVYDNELGEARFIDPGKPIEVIKPSEAPG